MGIRVFSDLHLEFNDWRPTPPRHWTDTIVLAGDIAPLDHHRLIPFLEWCIDNHEAVIYVPGNHEFYHNHLAYDWDKLSIPGVTKLNTDTVYEAGKRFIGATLWTDLSNPMHELTASQYMNDYRIIRTANYRKLRPSDTTSMYFRDKRFILENAQKGNIVVTHHAPTSYSVDPRYIGDPLNCAYFTDMHEIVDLPELLWIHGHTHNRVDYVAGKVRVVSNPKGYGNENPNFDPTGYIL